MSEDEVTARIAVLEAVVYTLIESVALQAAGERGMAGVNQVVETISYAVGERLSDMPPTAKELQRLAEIIVILERNALDEKQEAKLDRDYEKAAAKPRTKKSDAK